MHTNMKLNFTGTVGYRSRTDNMMMINYSDYRAYLLLLLGWLALAAVPDPIVPLCLN